MAFLDGFRAKIGRKLVGKLAPETTLRMVLAELVGKNNRRQKKSAKGTVKVESDRGRLRLRFTCQGKRYYFAIGLPNTDINRKVAEQRARQIELDILSGNFDPTLEKYKPERSAEKTNVSLLTSGELLEQFIASKAQSVSTPRSLEKYKTVLKHLQTFRCKDGLSKGPLANKPAIDLGTDCTEQFYQHLANKLTELTLKQSLVWLSAGWQWGLKKRLVEYDPWKALASRVKVPPKQMPKPFTREEVRAIVEGFQSDRYYAHYADYVEFLFGTGCRTGEAIGLRWKHLNENCTTVWIGESLSRKVRKATKTNRARTITLTLKLQSLLLARRPENPDPEGLVFVSPKGKPIDDHNFRNRAWKSVLERLGIEYRKPYNTRHTLISHALDMGMSPVTVAQLTGHDVQTLFENYAGNVNSRAILPEL